MTDTADRPVRPGPARNAAVAAGYLVAYVIARLVASDHGIEGVALPAWNAAPVLSLGLVAQWGLRWAPLTLLAPLAALALGFPPVGGDLPAPLAVGVEAAVATAVGWALSAARDFQTTLDRRHDVLVLLAAGSGAAGAQAAFDAGLMAAFGSVPGGALGAVMGRLFLLHLVAILSVLPVLLVYGRSSRRPPVRFAVSIEGVLQVGALLVIGWEVFAGFINAEFHYFYLLFLPFAWIASRRGQPALVIALAATYVGLIASDWTFGHRDVAILDLQVRMVALAVTSLLLGAVACEKRAADIRTRARQAELAHVQRLNVGWEMASGMAHEINQPVSAAMNYLQAAVRLINNPDSDRARIVDVMGKSLDQIERIGDIVRNLRDFMRKGETNQVRARLAGIAEDAVGLVRPEATAAEVSLQLDVPASLPPVFVDKTQITQVLVNLVRNAVQAIELSGGGGTGEVRISAEHREGAVLVTVADTGPGFDAEVAQRLFEPFVTTKEAGMGLGLSITKSIIEAHGGRIWLDTSTPGGTIFRFTLPIATGDDP